MAVKLQMWGPVIASIGLNRWGPIVVFSTWVGLVLRCRKGRLGLTDWGASATQALELVSLVQSQSSIPPSLHISGILLTMGLWGLGALD